MQIIFSFLSLDLQIADANEWEYANKHAARQRVPFQLVCTMFKFSAGFFESAY